jgi:putative nucleotidyltransferase with HDIG domain
VSAFVPEENVRLSEVISALSVALDLTEGQPMGHAMRSCIVGMRIAEELRLPPQQRADLYYALLLKDAGCSSNSARLHQIMGSDDLQTKFEVKFEDWSRVSLAGIRYLSRNVLPDAPLHRRLFRMAEVALKLKPNNAALIGARCQRGAEIARSIGLNDAVADAIRDLDEHWDGGGFAAGRKGEEISILARIMNVSQTMEVFASRSEPQEAIDAVVERRGRWFDPEIVRAVQSLADDRGLWRQFAAANFREYVLALEPGIALPATPQRIDDICEAFAQVIDAKSPYTFHHSTGVAAASTVIAEEMHLESGVCTLVRRAALLHDIGKLGVSNSILEKPGALTNAEWQVMRKHPVYTRLILEEISGFQHLAYVAAAHHERLDGKGYPNGLTARQLSLPARIVAVADVFQALTEKRPYREGLPLNVVFEMMEKEAVSQLDPDCLSALKKRTSPADVTQSSTASGTGQQAAAARAGS